MRTRIWFCLSALALLHCGYGNTGSLVPDFGGAGPGNSIDLGDRGGGWDGGPFLPPPDGGLVSNGDGGTMTPTDMAGAPLCDVSLRRCPHDFSYAGSAAMPLTGNEQNIEVRGNYRSDGWTKGDPMTLSSGVWRATVALPWNGNVLYKILITYKDQSVKWIADPGDPNSADDGQGGKNSVLMAGTCSPYSCSQPVSTCGAGPPGAFDWRDAVLYFTFVDRFVNGNPANDMPLHATGLQTPANWQGGDWAGVMMKIQSGYFQSLGINTLWVTVPVDNTEGTGIGTDGMLYSAYHGYWPRDLSKTETRFGSLADLKALVSAAHAANMRVLLDYAMNHVHKDSPTWLAHGNDGWFNPLMVNGQECTCGSNVCPWDGPTARTCWFTNYLPDFNFNNPGARDFSVGNAIFWIGNSGADGFRLDAIKHVELSWLTDLRSRLNAQVEPITKQHVYLVGETFTGDRALIKSFIDPCTMLDGQFDFPLRAQMVQTVLQRQGKMGDLIGFMDGNASFYGSGVMSTFIGNHDVPRAIHFAEDAPAWGNVWADGKDRAWQNQPGVVAGSSAYERVALAMTLLMTNQGIPLIYYGDEVGQPGAGDPDNRRMMSWSGYNAGQQWLLARMKALGGLRAMHGAFRRGSRTTLSADDDSWVYQMVDGADRAIVAMNRSDFAKTVGGLPAGVTLKDQLSGDMLSGPSIPLPPRAARIFLLP